MGDNVGNKAKEETKVEKNKEQFLVLLCDHGEKWTKHTDVFQKAFYPELEQVMVHVSQDEALPDYTKLQGYRAIVLSGSTYNLEDDEKWMDNIQKWIRDYLEYSKTTYTPKMLGICFGHQLLNKTFGGECGENKKHPEFSLGINDVQLSEEFRSKPWAKGVKNSVQLYKCHGNAVNSPAKNAQVLAGSTQTDNEIMIYSDQIFSLQPHPEMTPDMMKNVLIKSLFEKGKISEEKKKEVTEQIETNPSDTKEFRKVILSFLEEHVDKFGQPKHNNGDSQKC